jgi:hypothetical protein
MSVLGIIGWFLLGTVNGFLLFAVISLLHKEKDTSGIPKLLTESKQCKGGRNDPPTGPPPTPPKGQGISYNNISLQCVSTEAQEYYKDYLAARSRDIEGKI